MNALEAIQKLDEYTKGKHKLTVKEYWKMQFSETTAVPLKPITQKDESESLQSIFENSFPPLLSPKPTDHHSCGSSSPVVDLESNSRAAQNPGDTEHPGDTKNPELSRNKQQSGRRSSKQSSSGSILTLIPPQFSATSGEQPFGGTSSTWIPFKPPLLPGYYPTSGGSSKCTFVRPSPILPHSSQHSTTPGDEVGSRSSSKPLTSPECIPFSPTLRQTVHVSTALPPLGSVPQLLDDTQASPVTPVVKEPNLAQTVRQENLPQHFKLDGKVMKCELPQAASTIRDDDKKAPQQINSSHTNSKAQKNDHTFRKSRKKKGEDKASPTSIYISLTDQEPLPKEDFCRFLRDHLGKRTGEFQVTHLEKHADHIEIEVQFSGKKAAKRALRILQQMIAQHPYLVVSLRDFSTGALVHEMISFKRSIDCKRNDYTAKHQTKIDNLSKKLDAVRQPKKCTPSQYLRMTEERKVLEAEIQELQQQKLEFEGHCITLLDKLHQLKSSAPSTSKPLELEERVRNMRKDFGKECVRFLNALPIYAKRGEIISVIRENQVTILIGETGSGKSTQVVQYLYDAGLTEKGLIACTQPRKVAAVTLAHHVSKEMGKKLGTILGYKFGTSGKYNKQTTKILYMTDHALLNECITDQDFSNYSCLVIDEAHERSLHTDLLLALIKQCLPRRRDLKVVITSATIHPDIFIRYFGGCPLITVPGRTFPVDVIWDPLNVNESPIKRNYVSDAVTVVKDIHEKEPAGDILVFLTSLVEIDCACETVRKDVGETAIVLPLHGKLQPEEQQKVFREYNDKRKIVFATNVAETSITISGIKYIVDTGLAKELRFDPQRNMNSLEVQLISKSSAEQRKGRAGRTSAGKCYRLYTETIQGSMPSRTLPEILRMHLAHAALKLFEFGVTDILAFDFVEPPNSVTLKAAVKTLEFVGAIKKDESAVSEVRVEAGCSRLTDVGRKMALLPLDPLLAKVLLDGIEAGIGLECAITVALSSLAGSVFFRGGTDEMKTESDKRKLQFSHQLGDQMTYLSVYYHWESQGKNRRTQWCVENYINAKSMRIVEEMVKELKAILSQNLEIILPAKLACLENAERKLPKMFFEAFIHNIGVFIGHQKAGYMTESIPGESLIIFPASALCQLNEFPKYIVYEKTLRTSQHFLLQVAPVKEEWVREAVESMKLQHDPAEQFRHYIVTPTTITNIGNRVFKFAIWKHLQGIREDMKITCNMAPVVIEPVEDQGLVTLFSQSCYHGQVRSLVEKRLVSERERLRKEYVECGVTMKEEDNVRLVVGSGGIIQHVLMPYHYRTIIVKGSTDSHWKDDVLRSLAEYGEIIDNSEPKVFGQRECRMFVTFRNPDDAVKAVVSFNAHEITIKPKHHHQGDVGSPFTLKVMWSRRKRQNFAFIEFASVENLTVAKQYLIHSTLHGVRFRASRERRDELFATNVGFHITEDALKAAIESAVPGLDLSNLKVKLGFEKSFPTTTEQLDALKHQLDGLIAKNATRGQYNTEICQPKNSHIWYVAFVSFKDPNEGQRVLNNLMGETLGDRQLVVKPLLSSSVRYPPPVYAVIKDAVKEVKSKLEDEYCKSVKIHENQDKWGNTILQIKSEDVTAFSVVKYALNTIMGPDVIPFQSPIFQQYVLSGACSQDLGKIQSSTSTYITRDLRSIAINIYGTEANRMQAKLKLDEQLRAIADHGTKSYLMQLNSPGKPPRLMKHLVSRFGLDLEGMMQWNPGIKGAKLDPHRQIITVFATGEAYSSLLQLVEEYTAQVNMSLCRPAAEINEVECCVCFTPITTASVIRLEDCGHPYCLECIEMQVAPNTITFPVQCAAEHCSQQFVWQDFRNLFLRTGSTQHKVVAASLKSYIGANRQTVHSCPTPDCDMVYVISDDGKRFVCSHCRVAVCTKCHVQYHDGLSCAMYQSGHCNDEEFEEWMRQDPHNRKRCPKCNVPIEKNEGCNHMTCRACHANICWVCLSYFDTASKCYKHMEEYFHY